MAIQGIDGKIRCFGGKTLDDPNTYYHDFEWGVISHDEHYLFEMLILEGVQAGLSWETVLKKRQAYRQAFHNFDPIKVANMHDDELENLRDNPAIIRNRLKIYAARQNAHIFLDIQQEFGSFNHYVWNFVEGKPQINHWQIMRDLPTHTIESDLLSKDLKKRKMTFVGSTIMYAYMQAIGMVNDHITSCWCYNRKT